MITRNIDVAGGVVNGTIGTIENIQPNLITVRRLRDNELMYITSVKHYNISLPHSNREQFPLILGYGSQSSGYDYKQQRICCIGFNICLRTGICGTK